MIGVQEQPRKLLARVSGAELVEMYNSDYCCGFGGSFSVKYPDISDAMVSDKVKNIIDTGADSVVGCVLFSGISSPARQGNGSTDNDTTLLPAARYQ